MNKIFRLCLALLLIGILVSCEEIPVPEEESLTLSKNELQFIGFSSTLSVKVDATREWRAVSSDWWIAVSPDHYPSAGQHFEANVAVTVSDNEMPLQRKGSVDFYIGDKVMATLTVLQDTLSEQDRPDEEFPISWANLQWKASNVIAQGDLFEAGCCVFADGITNVLDSETGEDITCDIGYSTENTRPDGEDWKWNPISFWEDWGNNFYYQGFIQDVLPLGTYYYTFRVRNGKGPYRYAGTDGLWDGENNLCGQFEVKNAEDPEEETDLSGFTIEWANIQWTDKTQIVVGDSLNAGSKVHIPGLTDVMTSLTGEGVYCEMGYGTSSDPHNSDWIWRKCPFSADWGQEFYFQGFTEGISNTGTYYYTFRYSLDKKQTYVYAGSDGLWDGTQNVCRQFKVTDSEGGGGEDPDEGPDLSGYTIHWANIQWTDKTQIVVGDSLNAGSKVHIPGLTDVMTSLTGEGVYCEMGYGTSSDPHNSDWIWRKCPFSADWGQEFYFQGFTEGIPDKGTYYYTFRYSIDKKKSFVYAGSDGLWDAATQPCKTFIVK